MLLQILIVGAVALIVFGYVRVTRGARERWLMKLDLPGRWRSDTDQLTLNLSGSLSEGQFVMQSEVGERRGRWKLKGHLLHLDGEPPEVLDLMMFKPGSIGLTDQDGARRVLYKEATNVVPLRRKRSDSEE